MSGTNNEIRLKMNVDDDGMITAESREITDPDSGYLKMILEWIGHMPDKIDRNIVDLIARVSFAAGFSQLYYHAEDMRMYSITQYRQPSEAFMASAIEEVSKSLGISAPSVSIAGDESVSNSKNIVQRAEHTAVPNITGSTIREYRHSLDMTQTEFGEMIGTTREYVCRIETGRCRLTKRFTQRIQKLQREARQC
jgi:DNA-binding transcriptional regulator YiaG